MPPRTGSIVALIAVLGSSSATWAKDDPASSRSAVQVRKYGFSEEIRLSVGSMPLDPFQKGWTGSLAYTHHFSDVLAWEVLQVTGALLTSTSLRDELINTFARRPEEFAAPRLMITTGAELSPFYGKQVLFNRETMHATAFLGLYAGAAFGDRPSLGQTLEDIRPTVGGGLGARVFISQLISTRFDARVFASFRSAQEANETAEVETLALLTLSLSFGFGDKP